jgi:DNA (cytosine-5)-methyltransferase 1
MTGASIPRRGGGFSDMAIHSISLCAGVGALDLGLRLADPDIRTVCYVEWAKFPAAVIAARIADKTLPDAVIWDDVTTFDGRPWRGRVDLITAGFPCQPVSLAGQRKGMADERFIWGDIARIIGEVRPGRVFLENVPGIITADDGRFLDVVLGSLVALGFDCEWDLFSAEETGAPHRRQRWFCLAVSNAGRGTVVGRSGICADASTSCGALADTGDRFVQEPGRGSQGRDGAGSTGENDVGHADHAGLERWRERSERAREWTARTTDGELGIPNSRQQQPGYEADTISQSGNARHEYSGTGRGVYPPARNDYAGWSAIDASSQPAIRRVADGMADGLDPSLFAYRNDRLKAVGNGVVPLTVATAWRELNDRIR